MNKKLIYSLCVLLMLSVSLNIFLLQPEYQTRMKAIAQAVTNTPLRGDVDGDGVVTASDARIVLRIAVGLEDDSTPQPPALTKEQAIEIYKNANNMIVHFMGYTVDWNNTIQYNEHFEAALVNATKAEMMQKFNQYLDIAFFDDYFDWMYVEVDNKVYQKNIPFGVESFSYSVHSELEYVDGIYTLNTIDVNSSIDGIFIRDADFSYIFEYQNGHWVLSKECIINGEKGELSYWGFFEHDFLENCTESQLPATRIKPVFADSSFYGTTTTMYRSPSHTSDTVRSVSLDDDIVVLGYNETDPDWVFVMHEHSFGWVRSNLINYEADEPEQKTDDTPLRGDVDGDGVVTAGDARIVLRIAVGLEDDSTPQPPALTQEQAIEIFKNAYRIFNSFCGFELDHDNTTRIDGYMATPVLATKQEMYQNFCKYLDADFFDDYFNLFYTEVDGTVYLLEVGFGGEAPYYYVYETIAPYGDENFLLESAILYPAGMNPDEASYKSGSIGYIFEYQNGNWVVSTNYVNNNSSLGELTFWHFLTTPRYFLEDCTDAELPETRISPVAGVPIVSGLSASLRNGPGNEYGTIKSVSLDADLFVLGYNEDNPDWVFVASRNTFGWINSELITY